ncbi:hypothetical protein [Arenimonas sp.]|uniref:hypothetical protein n=1 Tax=Arenimonas sp. TaxID=1872635 RepID=UPI0035B3D829
MSARRKKHPWVIGDVFLVPLRDGSHCPGQVVGREPDLLNCVAIALFDARGAWSESWEPAADSIFSKLFVSRDALDLGQWPVVGRRASALARPGMPNESLRDVGFVGAKVVGSDIVDEFVNAYFGLMPWDDWYVPDYLDDLLVSPDRKPTDRLVYCGRHPR